MPYNYLIDDRIRQTYDLTYKNTIIIFDEAHNLPSTQEEVSSFELKASMLDKVAKELAALQEQREYSGLKEWKCSKE